MDEITNPFESLHNAITFDSRDWGQDRRLAWIYGIIVGWGDEICTSEDIFQEFKVKFGWDRATWNRLQKLHEDYLKHKEMSKIL